MQFIPLYKGNWSPAPHTGSVDATVSGDTWCCCEARPGSGRALLNQPAKVSWPLCFEAARDRLSGDELISACAADDVWYVGEGEGVGSVWGLEGVGHHEGGHGKPSG